MTPRAVLLAALLASVPGMAQDAGSEPVALLSDEIEAFRSTQERFAARMEELEADTRQFLAVREQEERARIDTSYDGTIAELEALEASERDAAIAQMRDFLARNPDNRYASHVRFRLADFEFEAAKERWLAEREAWDALADEAGPDAELPPDPKVDLSGPIGLYERIVADNRDLPREAQYEPLDAVLYMLGFAYGEPGCAQQDLEKSRAAFDELIALRPDSDLADAAHLMLGNYWFDKNRFASAIEEYRIVVDQGRSGLYYTEATYQLAWAYYKLAGPKVTAVSLGPEAWDQALDLFAVLLDQSEEEEEETGRESDYRPDAIRYVAISVFDVSDWSARPPIEIATDFFERVGPREWEADVYVALAEVLEKQGRYDEAIAVYRKLQDDPRWVGNPENPEYQMRIVQLHAQKRPPDLDASAQARVELSDRYAIEGEWFLANADNPDAQTTARKFIEESLADVAIEYRRTAEKTGRRDDYVESARRFRDYLLKFPIADDYYLMQWYLADTLYRAEQYDEALAEYTSLLGSAKYHQFGDGAVYFAMDAALKRLQRDHAPPVVSEVALPSDLLAIAQRDKVGPWLLPTIDAVERTYETPGGAIVPVYALSDDHAAFVRAADRLLAHQFGPAVDEIGIDFTEVIEPRRPVLEYLVAQILWFHDRYDEARPRLLDLIERHPRTREAFFASGLVVESYQRENDLASVRLYSRKFMALALGPDQGAAAERQEEFASLLEGAAFKEALALVDAGDRLAAAEAFLAFTRDFPDSEHVPLALYNSANSYEIVGRPEDAGRLFEEYLRRWPDDERSKALYFRVAQNAEATFDLPKAIKYYEEIVKRFPRDPEAADAQYNASFLRIGTGDYRGAAQGFEKYGKSFPDAADREEVVFQAGEAWEKVSDAEARKFYERYLAAYGLQNPDHAFEAKHTLAEIWLRANNPRRAKAYDAEILADFDRLATAGARLGFGARHYAGMAALAELQARGDKFAADRLTGREDKDLVLLMETKPGQLVGLEDEALRIARTYGDFESTTGALYVVARSYLAYADLGFSLEPPASMSPEEQDVYWEILESEVFPKFYAVQDKAVSRFKAVLELAEEQDRWSDWVGAAKDALNELDPRAYPKEKVEIQGEVHAEITPTLRALRPADRRAP